MGVIGEPYFKNLRDLGGLACQDGRHIKSGKIYRSPKLYADTPEAKQIIDDLHLDVIFDFRVPEEIKEYPDYVPEGVTYTVAEVYPGDAYPTIVVSKKAKLRAVLLLFKKGEAQRQIRTDKDNSYKAMPLSKAYNKVWEAMDQGLTFDFHCTEGKDRTGICAAIIEYALGRDEEGIKEEYLYSNVCRPNKDRSWMGKYGVPDTMLSDFVHAETTHLDLLKLSLDAVLEQYDSIDTYLAQHFGITADRMARWRDLYCE